MQRMVQTIGRNLDDENDAITDYQYQWYLKLNKVLQTTLERLLEIGRGKKNIINTNQELKNNNL